MQENKTQQRVRVGLMGDSFVGKATMMRALFPDSLCALAPGVKVIPCIGHSTIVELVCTRATHGGFARQR